MIVFDDFKSEIVDLRKKNESLIHSLETTKAELSELQQNTRRTNLEISGVPISDNENTDNVVIEIAKVAGVEITPKDIDISHWLPSTVKK